MLVFVSVSEDDVRIMGTVILTSVLDCAVAKMTPLRVAIIKVCAQLLGHDAVYGPAVFKVTEESLVNSGLLKVVIPKGTLDGASGAYYKLTKKGRVNAKELTKMLRGSSDEYARHLEQCEDCRKADKILKASRRGERKIVSSLDKLVREYADDCEDVDYLRMHGHIPRSDKDLN